MLYDYIVHFAVEVVGQMVLWLAYNHARVKSARAIWTDLCTQPWHRPAIWLFGTAITSIATVHLAG
jgi:hypothetical protein